MKVRAGKTFLVNADIDSVWTVLTNPEKIVVCVPGAQLTETIDEETRIKSDSNEGVSVLKLNEIRDFSTGIYDYNAMTSTFVPLDGSRKQGIPTKVSISMQEWCGQVWEQLLVGQRDARRTLRSYWEEEGDVDEDWAVPAGAVFADALPFLARGLGGPWLEPGEERTVPWFPTLLERRLTRDKARLQQARLARSASTETVDVPAGSFSAFSVTARPESGAQTTWYIEAEPPHRLVRWTRSDGEEAGLLASTRSPYWRQNGSGDRNRREALGLPPHRWPARTPDGR